MSGKGSSPRPFSVSKEVFDNNWELIFRKNKMTENKTGTCGCGRSPTGDCIGWHALTESEYAERKEGYETGRLDLNGKEID